MSTFSRPTAQRNPELCTIAQAADYLTLTERSVRRYVAEGRLPAFRVGEKQIRLRTADVAALLVPIVSGGAA